MPEPDLSAVLAAAATLLLRPPDATVLAALAESNGVALEMEKARQDFYDVLCVPQSGRYIPPYAHVLLQGRSRENDWWYFPAPRYDGGDALASWYEAAGFSPRPHDIDPMLRGPHRPLDNAGLIIAFGGDIVGRLHDPNDASAAGLIANNFYLHAFAGNIGQSLDVLRIDNGEASTWRVGASGEVRLGLVGTEMNAAYLIAETGRIAVASDQAIWVDLLGTPDLYAVAGSSVSIVEKGKGQAVATLPLSPATLVSQSLYRDMIAAEPLNGRTKIGLPPGVGNPFAGTGNRPGRNGAPGNGGQGLGFGSNLPFNPLGGRVAPLQTRNNSGIGSQTQSEEEETALLVN